MELGGFSQATVLLDEPATFLTPGQPPYEPRNWDDQFSGVLTVRENLNQSRNIPAVKALEAASAEAVADRARELGYEVEPYFALALGSFEVTPIQHASAFGAFANGGVQVDWHVVTRVEDADGNVLYEARAAGASRSGARRRRTSCSTCCTATSSTATRPRSRGAPACPGAGSRGRRAPPTTSATSGSSARRPA